MSKQGEAGRIALDSNAAKGAIALEGVGPRAPRAEEDVFLDECIRWLREWEECHKSRPRPLGVSVFIWQKVQRANSLLSGSKELTAFKESFTQILIGRAFSCTNSMKRVFGVSLPPECQDVPTVANWLHQKKLSKVLAIVFIPDQKAVVVLPIDGKSQPLRVPLAPTAVGPFSFGQLDGVLERFYRYGVSTHQGHCRIWEDPPARVLRTEPEKIVQGSLTLFLKGLIEMHRLGEVRVEVSNSAGRNDIEIICKEETGYRIGILELKVLSRKKSEAKNLEWAIEGVGQVLGYAEEYKEIEGDSKVDALYVCCYDGRKSDNKMPELFAKAKSSSVSARRYFMETPGTKRKHTTFTA